MGHDNRLDNRQSQTSAAAGRCSRAINAVETLENIGQILLINAHRQYR